VRASLEIRHYAYQETASSYDGIIDLDNREHESLLVEVAK
jgi:hypothetical protein